jgi:multidrug resistance efflux pump
MLRAKALSKGLKRLYRDHHNQLSFSMASKAATDEQMRNEIARLTASINQHKNQPSASRYSYSTTRQNAYVHPSYNSRTSIKHYDKNRAAASVGITSSASTSQVKEVVLGGVAFESSARSLVRKDRKISCLFGQRGF